MVPLRRGESEAALETFVASIRSRNVPVFALRALLLDALHFVDRHTGDHIPTLVERFVAECGHEAGCLDVFERCISDALRLKGVRRPLVRQLITMVEEGYKKWDFKPHSVADSFPNTFSSLETICMNETGLTLGDHLRRVRTAHGARLLRTTTLGIKEIAGAAGYKHESTFTRQFTKELGMTPTEYRGRVIVAAPRPSGDEKPETASTPRASGSLPARAGAILVVDDDEAMRITTAQYLRLRGYDVSEAQSGRAALDAAVRKTFGAVVLDLCLGDMSGLECLRQLRAHKGGGQAGVLIVTADVFAVDEHREDAERFGATMHSKLCDADEICELVDRLMDQPSAS
jgi:CheY-like chemotaxis protein/AraC-like DNA-binding protein